MRTIALLLVLPSLAHAQVDRLTFIKQEVKAIDQDLTLEIDTLGLGTATGVYLDGGGEITYHYRDSRLVKIREDIFPSFGSTLTEYYFHNDTLMLIRDLEAHFPFLPDSTGLDHTRLVTKFEAHYYMWGVDEDVALEQTGVRVLSEGPCGNLEWEPTVERWIAIAPRQREK